MAVRSSHVEVDGTKYRIVGGTYREWTEPGIIRQASITGSDRPRANPRPEILTWMIDNWSAGESPDFEVYNPEEGHPSQRGYFKTDAASGFLVEEGIDVSTPGKVTLGPTVATSLTVNATATTGPHLGITGGQLWVAYNAVTQELTTANTDTTADAWTARTNGMNLQNITGPVSGHMGGLFIAGTRSGVDGGVRRVTSSGNTSWAAESGIGVLAADNRVYYHTRGTTTSTLKRSGLDTAAGGTTVVTFNGVGSTYNGEPLCSVAIGSRIYTLLVNSGEDPRLWEFDGTVGKEVAVFEGLRTVSTLWDASTPREFMAEVNGTIFVCGYEVRGGGGSSQTQITLRDSTEATVTPAATSIALPRPTIESGDVVLIGVYGEASSFTFGLPSGFTSIRDTSVEVSPARRLMSAYKIITNVADEPSSYVVTTSAAAIMYGVAASYSGVATLNPVDVSSENSATSGTTLTASSVTTSGTNRMLVSWMGVGTSSAAPTTPSGFTSREDGSTGGDGGRLSDSRQAAAGASGAKTATVPESSPWGAHLIALSPVPAVLPSDPQARIDYYAPASGDKGSIRGRTGGFFSACAPGALNELVLIGGTSTADGLSIWRYSFETGGLSQFANLISFASGDTTAGTHGGKSIRFLNGVYYVGHAETAGTDTINVYRTLLAGSRYPTREARIILPTWDFGTSGKKILKAIEIITEDLPDNTSVKVSFIADDGTEISTNASDATISHTSGTRTRHVISDADTERTFRYLTPIIALSTTDATAAPAALSVTLEAEQVPTNIRIFEFALDFSDQSSGHRTPGRQMTGRGQLGTLRTLRDSTSNHVFTFTPLYADTMPSKGYPGPTDTQLTVMWDPSIQQNGLFEATSPGEGRMLCRFREVA